MTEVYVGICADILHSGHVNLLAVAAKYGKVTVGLLSDEAIIHYKTQPILTYQERASVIGAIKFVWEVIVQDEPSPVANINMLRPKYFIHGDDWKNGPLVRIRQQTIVALEKCGGSLIEIPYTSGISSSAIKDRILRGLL